MTIPKVGYVMRVNEREGYWSVMRINAIGQGRLVAKYSSEDAANEVAADLNMRREHEVT